MKNRIFMIEDNLLIRTAVRRILTDSNEFEMVGEADDAIQLETQIKNAQPHLILLDLRLKTTDGFSALAEIKKKFPNIKVVIYTMKDDKPSFLACVKAGADGYLLKSDNPTALLEGLRMALVGNFVTSRQFAQSPKKSEDLNFNPLEKKVVDELKLGVPLTKILERHSLSKEQLESVLISLKVTFGANSYPDLVRIIKENRIHV
ncbi:response regulator transcription factor [Leptospira sp. 96542]|nr:response regulator transcription factor [Leptospira sp. 96542]